MTRDEIDLLWHKAMHTAIAKGELFTRFEFANLIEKHLIASGYRRCAEGQRTTQYCAMVEEVEEAVKAEREVMQKIAEAELSNTAMLASMPPQSSAAWNILQAIRARGEA
jgi:hypothetical protein